MSSFAGYFDFTFLASDIAKYLKLIVARPRSWIPTPLAFGPSLRS
jgi:hypothetical protein